MKLRSLPLVLVGLMASSYAAHAGWSGDGLVAYRSLPQGAAVQADPGFEYRLWGAKNSAADFEYGYIRLAAPASTSLVVNRIGAQIEIFPISIMGLVVGQSYSSRSVDLDTLPCDQVDCHGRLAKTYFRFHLVGAYGDLFFRPEWSIENQNFSRETVYGDEGSNLVGTTGGDVLVKSEVLVGYALAPDWKVAFLAARAHMQNVKPSENKFWGVIGIHDFKMFDRSFSATAAIGRYESTFWSPGLTVAAVLSTPLFSEPSLQLGR